MYCQEAENKKDKENKASFTETVRHSVEVVDDKMRKKQDGFCKRSRCVINLTDCS